VRVTLDGSSARWNRQRRILPRLVDLPAPFRRPSRWHPVALQLLSRCGQVIRGGGGRRDLPGLLGPSVHQHARAAGITTIGHDFVLRVDSHPQRSASHGPAHPPPRGRCGPDARANLPCARSSTGHGASGAPFRRRAGAPYIRRPRLFALQEVTMRTIARILPFLVRARRLCIQHTGHAAGRTNSTPSSPRRWRDDRCPVSRSRSSRMAGSWRHGHTGSRRRWARAGHDLHALPGRLHQ